jgi:hypothetical protein
VCVISLHVLHLQVTVSDPSQKSHIILSGNQSNSAENDTSFHTGACLDGWETDEISTLINHFFTLSFGQ